MISRNFLISVVLALIIAALTPSADAFAPASPLQLTTTQRVAPTLNVFGGGKKKKDDMDLSDIEVRDMTREEMIELNRQNEEVMNMELSMMTGFSLVLSLPILYLCWVAFFSE